MTPADTDPYAMCAAAAEHIAAGRAAEIECEWWADPDDGDQRRMTITFRSTAGITAHMAAIAGRAPDPHDPDTSTTIDDAATHWPDTYPGP